MTLSPVAQESIKKLFDGLGIKHNLPIDDVLMVMHDVLDVIADEFDCKVLEIEAAERDIANVRIRDFILNAQHPHPN